MIRGVWLGLALCAAGAAAAEPATEPRATMRQVFDALTTLLPASLDPRGVDDPGAAAAYAGAMARLRTASRELARHGDAREAGFRGLARSLADDVEDSARRLEAGRRDEARFGVVLLTQRCIECHNRLPSADAFPMADRLMGQIEIESLPAADRALLEVAVRRFDRALATWEALLGDARTPAVALDLEGILADYLTVAIRVRREPARARRTLEAFAARPDVPRYLASRLAGWSAALDELAAAPSGEPSLARARFWLERAHRASALPTSRQGLVFDLAASGELLRFAEAASAFGPSAGVPGQLAEAYFLLGVVEERTATSFFLPRTDEYMEAALRADPTGPLARPAYDRVEEGIYAEHGGPPEEELPEELRARLAALARLLDPGAPGSRAGAEERP